jgi:V8-like Glu-specific endopeptidase
MRRRGRHAGRSGSSPRPLWLLRRPGLAVPSPPASAASVLALLALALVVLSPAGTAADAGIDALTESVPLSAASFAGTPAVGALLKGGPGGSHFCTASVVNSPGGDLIVTAAHCVSGYASDPGSISFAPGYHDGRAPYGTWTVSRIDTSPQWQSDGDQDDDVAFLSVQGPVQKYTGAERLDPAARAISGGSRGTVVRVIGYPDGQGRPVTCQNHVTMLSPTQMEFDCRGYTDGTSGGPFLTSIDAVTGAGTISGVVGGYQQGGDTPDVSYSPAFGPDVQALYRSAAGQG